jgi:ribosomal-protein-alanine N-acetyltransferase
VTIATLQTSHLLLRPWAADDTPALFQILQEADIFKYFPPSPPATLKRTESYIAHQLAHWQERGFGHWAVVTQDDNQVVGWNGLEYLPELDEVEVAYLLSQHVRGRGYASEAAHAALEFGFETCALSTIIGLVHPENVPSVHILEKSGLVYSDKLTLWGLDMSRYRITRSDYEQQHKISPP